MEVLAHISHERMAAYEICALATIRHWLEEWVASFCRGRNCWSNRQLVFSLLSIIFSLDIFRNKRRPESLLITEIKELG